MFAVIGLVAVLVSIATPTSAQTAETLEPAAVSGVVDPAAVVDVDGFAERATAWAAAQLDHRANALARADALATEVKAAEDAEQARVEAEQLAREAEAQAVREAEVQARRAAQTTTTTSTAPPAPDTVAGDEQPPTTTAAAVVPAGPTPEQWQALRVCESGENYQAVSSTGRYRGAYQFSITTWDWLAGIRYVELAGVDPIAAAPADQDKMAFALYDIYADSPWPVCGRHLR